MDEILQDTTNVVKTGVRVGREVYKYKKAVNTDKLNKTLQMLQSLDQPFVFTGNISDLSYFWKNKTLSLQTVNDLANENVSLYQSVLKTLGRAVMSGDLRCENDVFAVTDKGLKRITSDNFISMAREEQAYAIQYQQQMLANTSYQYVELNGNIGDLQAFNYVNAIKLSDIENNQRVKDLFAVAHDKGVVEIDGGKGIVTLTEQGKNYIKSPSFSKMCKPLETKMNGAVQVAGFSKIGKVVITLKKIVTAMPQQQINMNKGD